MADFLPFRANGESAIEVGVEHAYPGDAVDRQPVAVGRFADRLRVRTVIDAERLAVVVAHVRVDPGDAERGVLSDDAHARVGACSGDGNLEAFRKGSLDDIARHRQLRSGCGCTPDYARDRLGNAAGVPRLAAAVAQFALEGDR